MLLIVRREHYLGKDYYIIDSESSDFSYSENGEVRLE
jgi:hypothetical protein